MLRYQGQVDIIETDRCIRQAAAESIERAPMFINTQYGILEQGSRVCPPAAVSAIATTDL